VATLDALRREGQIEATVVDQAIRDLGLQPEKGDPREA
jgi:pyruvate dehydrogenase complex dehydrogenase (E1) component